VRVRDVGAFRCFAFFGVALLSSVSLLAGGALLGSGPEVVEYRALDAQDIPAALAIAPDGAVWFTLESSDAVGVLRDGRIERVSRGRETIEPLGLAAGVASACLPGTQPTPVGPGAGQAPGVSSGAGASLGIVQWSHFVPAYDTWFDKYVEDWGAKNKIQVTVDHVPNLEMPARLAAEAAAKTGHDVIQFTGQVQTYRYENLLVDLSDVVDYGTKKWGEPIKYASDLAHINGVWRALPDHYIVIAPLVRDDLMHAIGDPKLETWDDVRQACAKLKPQGNAAGLAISHCNDANHNWRSIMWTFGASEVKEDGKTLNVDTPEFREFLKFTKAFYDEGITPEVFAWDDASDNRWLGSGQGGFIHDAISSLRSIEQPNKPLFDSISIRPALKGPAGQLEMPDANLYAMWDFAKNKEAGKQFLKDYLDNWKEAMTQSTGYNMPFFSNLFQKPMPVIGESKKLEILQDWKEPLIHTFGYPGPPNAAAQEVLAAFHIPDIIGIYVRGNTSLDDTVKEAVSRIKPIYDKYNK
jgi:multiple sugar transport system substrate-binding protein